MASKKSPPLGARPGFQPTVQSPFGVRPAQAGQQDPVAVLKGHFTNRQFARVLKAAKKLPKSLTNDITVLTLIGASQMELGKLKPAEATFRKSLSVNPERPAGHYNLALALQKQGKSAQAVAAFKAALVLRPDYAEALNGLGGELHESGDIEAARTAFSKAATLKPTNPEIWTNLGNLHQKAGQFDKAEKAYETALSHAPHHANAHYGFGMALKSTGDLEGAVAHYRDALAARPDFVAAWNNLGNALQSLGDLLAAEQAVRKALEIAPKDARALNSLGTVLQKIGRLDEAVEAYGKAIASEPDLAMAQAQRLHQLAHMCDWQAYADFERVRDTLGIVGDEIPPLTLLAMEDAPERQSARARTYATAVFKAAKPAPKPPAKAKRPERLRVGYFSADYRDHPVARLIAGTLAAHDTDRFELFAYSFGPNTSQDYRAEIAGSFAKFTDIRATGDGQAARMVAKDKLDIAIDLTCYTQHSRTALFADRLAPVQINYLGYPGTTGAEFIDYALVDPVIVPAAEREHMREAALFMPHCYQPNDNRRDVPKDHRTRADHGLPEDGVVLCCFNSTYKIMPETFAIWMRVLAQVQGSVLWLLESNSWAKENLRKHAQAAGIDPARLVFAPRMSNAEHLARHAHADLFVDTFAYNAHTTGSDALWMSVPIVTLQGQQFAARVCASLLRAVNLPELITETPQAYEALILDLARDPERRRALRARLDGGRREVPLFDTDGYTRALEELFDAAHARWRAGKDPADISLG